MEAINCKGVSFTYPDSSEFSVKDISFTINDGEFCLVTGESAAGKSTLLKLLKREIAPAGDLSGELSVNAEVGYVSQNVAESIVCDRVRSELSFGLTNRGMKGESVELLTAEIASYFNLDSKLDSEISELSGGEKQLVNLASVMVMKPRILVLDEPCSQLDPVACERFISMVKRLHRDFRITVIMSEHSTDMLFEYADKILLLDSGRQLSFDTPHNTFLYLKNNDHPMLKAAPLRLRIENPDSIKLLQLQSESPSSAVLTAKNICFAYEKGNDILKGVSFSAHEGKINAIVGANASGKTTLLKVIAGVRKQYRGSVKCKKRISMLTQNVYDLFTKETCADEVTFGETTDYLGIDCIKDRHPYDISGGQAQRLALAKVLEKGADVILLDEPTQGLDALLKNKLAALLKSLTAKGKTVILVTHDLDFAGECADYVSYLSGGKIIASMPYNEFFRSLSFYTTSVSRLTMGRAAALRDIADE